MASFKITGGYQLNGEITPQGAKNEALQIICATLLTDKKIKISNIPDILDVNNLIMLLKTIGVKVSKTNKNEYTFQSDNINIDYFHTDDFLKNGGKLRGSVMLMGPMLARFGFAIIPAPGGDKIGRRRLDTHFEGIKLLGANFTFDTIKGIYKVDGKKLTGAKMTLEEASVTGTANIIMASVFAEGKTKIYNAACEPYIQQLCKMLIRMGAKIEGHGTNLIKIEGVESLNGCEHTIMPDMIEIGSFIGMAAMTMSELTIKNSRVEDLGMMTLAYKKLGIEILQKGNDIYIPKYVHYKIDSFIDGSILTIADAPWPGLTPDILSVLLVVATQANGSVLIHQKMFESRLFYVDKLIDMGAKIILCDPHRATVIGLNREVNLRSSVMTSPDIRAGISLLIAALSADGTSIIHNVEQIDRGYENIESRLTDIGARIERI
ncbi:MAG: UDP-N-acetylglucosamine 1-carboxyvinyltransferase [Saprospiraceae bacterium]